MDDETKKFSVVVALMERASPLALSVWNNFELTKSKLVERRLEMEAHGLRPTPKDWFDGSEITVKVSHDIKAFDTIEALIEQFFFVSGVRKTLNPQFPANMCKGELLSRNDHFSTKFKQQHDLEKSKSWGHIRILLRILGERIEIHSTDR